MTPDRTGGVVFVHAHPDDESFATGGAIARLVAEGTRVDLVTCTDGAEGEIHDPTLDPEEARPRLAQIRARELECSVQALGDGSIHHHLLGYRDSGMIGTDANAHPDSFWQAEIEDATRRLIAIVREARPAAIVTYDENGNYGHPDHINAARIAREAYAAAADASVHPDAGPPHRVSRFYEIAFGREDWFALMGEMRERGIPLPWNMDDDATQPGEAGEKTGTAADDLDPANFAAVAEVAEDVVEGAEQQVEWGRPAEEITTRVDVRAHIERKRRSMDCHRTQRQDLGWVLELPADLVERVIGTEYFVLRWRDGEPVPSTHREEHLLP